MRHVGFPQDINSQSNLFCALLCERAAVDGCIYSAMPGISIAQQNHCQLAIPPLAFAFVEILLTLFVSSCESCFGVYLTGTTRALSVLLWVRHTSCKRIGLVEILHCEPSISNRGNDRVRPELRADYRIAEILFGST